jgi:adenylate cyclase
MAASAPVGTVQATEAAYGQLRQDFLFRPRGSFYLPNIGAARTFVLAGRL